jgi:2-hydroxychromene-2-carboxylate isomerase
MAHTQMAGIAARTGATVDSKPILLGGIFKATGNRSPVEVPAKGRHMVEVDLQRWAAHWGVPPVVFPEGFPINTLPLMRGAIACAEDGGFEAYVDSVFAAIFRDAKDMADPAAIGTVISEAGLDAKHIFACVQEDAVKQALIAATEEAVERGVFGAPTFFIDGEMWWGQDRLDWVEEAAAA